MARFGISLPGVGATSSSLDPITKPLQTSGLSSVSNAVAPWENKVSAVLSNPLSSSTGGIWGGQGGIVNFNTGGAGVKSNSLQGGLSNQNNRYGLIALGTYFGGNYLTDQLYPYLAGSGGTSSAASGVGSAVWWQRNRRQYG